MKINRGMRNVGSDGARVWGKRGFSAGALRITLHVGIVSRAECLKNGKGREAFAVV
jgi:hypothetical protein